jgi:hypothetical protein
VIGIVAILVVVGLAVVLWRLASQYGGASRPGRDDVDELDDAPPRESWRRRPPRTTVVPPDDDPEFLADLARRTRPDDEQK